MLNGRCKERSNRPTLRRYARWWRYPPHDALTSDATADGTFTWDGRTFKSNWVLAPARWNLPFGDQKLRFKATRASG